MNNALIERPALDAKVVEQVLLGGDLSKLSSEQRLSYYQRTCESLGLNPLTKPFDYLTLNGKTILYARKDATEQLRNSRHISVTIKAREVVEGCYVVTAQARDGKGREDESIGAVPIEGLKGEARSNAMMKAETKAKRRVTLSICGLGMLDEIEVDSIPNAQVGDPLPAVVVEPLSDVKPPASLPEGAVLIERVEQGQTAKGKAYWLYALSTGEVVKDWEQRRSGLAEQCVQERTPVRVETRETKWGTDVTALHKADTERVIQLRGDEPPLESYEDGPF